MDKIGHFREDDSKRIAAFFRRRGDRKQARPSRPRRRIRSDGGGDYRTAWAQAPDAGIPANGTADFTIITSYDGGNSAGDVVTVTSTFSEVAFETGNRRGTIGSYNGTFWFIVNEDRICPVQGTISYDGVTWLNLSNGNAINAAPTVTPAGTNTFTQTGSLPIGLGFDTATGVVDGVVSSGIDNGSFTVEFVGDTGATGSVTIPWAVQ